MASSSTGSSSTAAYLQSESANDHQGSQQQQSSNDSEYDPFASLSDGQDPSAFFNGSTDSFMETLRSMSGLSSGVNDTTDPGMGSLDGYYSTGPLASTSTSSMSSPPSPRTESAGHGHQQRKSASVMPPPARIPSRSGSTLETPSSSQPQQNILRSSSPSTASPSLSGPSASAAAMFFQSPPSTSPTVDRSSQSLFQGGPQGQTEGPNGNRSQHDSGAGAAMGSSTGGPPQAMGTPQAGMGTPLHRNNKAPGDRGNLQTARSFSAGASGHAGGGEEDFSPVAPVKGEKMNASLSSDAHDTPSRSMDESESAADKRQSSRFVYKLMRMVSDPESQHLICFNNSGTSVVVHDFDEFAKQVLPKHFKHSNFSSFIRQLNMYGFYKVNKTPRGQRQSNDGQFWEFSHPKFLRGRTDLLEDIRRKALDSDHGRNAAAAAAAAAAAGIAPGGFDPRDPRLSMSMGQSHTRAIIEDMQWRLDQTMEQNYQLRDCAIAMRDTIVNIIEYLKAAKGGPLPFEVHLPSLLPLQPTDMMISMPSPMPSTSPFVANGQWSAMPSQQPHQANTVPSQPMVHVQHPQMQTPHQAQMQMAAQRQHHPTPPQQQEGPSIFVTEPAQQQQQQQQQPHPQVQAHPHSPFSPQDPANGAWSMANLGHVSPLMPGSRRVSAASSVNNDASGDMAHGSEFFTPPSYSPGQIGDPGAGRPGGMDERAAFANLPRRSMSNRIAAAGLNIQTASFPGSGGGSSDLGQLPNSAGAYVGMPRSAGADLGGAGGPGSVPMMQSNSGSGDHRGPNASAAQGHMQNFALPGSSGNPGLGVMSMNQPQQQYQVQSMPASPLGPPNTDRSGQSMGASLNSPHHPSVAQQQQHFFSAANTPLPPSPAVSGYQTPNQQIPYAGGSGMPGFSNTNGNHLGVSPSMLSAPSFDHFSTSSSPDDMNNSGVFEDALDSSSVGDSSVDASFDSAAAPPPKGSAAANTILARRNNKAMRTPMKRTASGHSEANVAAAQDAMLAANNAAQQAGKRKSPH